MPSLNVDLDYFDHIKTRRLVGLLGRGAEVLPIQIWCICGKHHAETGRLAGYSAQEIETLCGWWGEPGKMLEAMVQAGFLDYDGEVYSVHDWIEMGRIHAMTNPTEMIEFTTDRYWAARILKGEAMRVDMHPFTISADTKRAIAIRLNAALP